jgi:hypothetical protein
MDKTDKLTFRIWGDGDAFDCASHAGVIGARDR